MDMTFNSGLNRTKLDKMMSQDQFDQVVEAILAGKYSWACVLILRFAGYNPLHYIPYRTYNRLMKDNRPGGRLSKQQTNTIDTDKKNSDLKAGNLSSGSRSSEISDLSYLETVNKHPTEVQGGAATKLLDLNPLIIKLVQNENWDKHRESSFLIRL